MDTDDLSLFARVARLGSISAAARDLGLAPAAASARLAAFERRLGTRLVQRTTRAASLTEDGHAFLPHAEAVLDAAEAARGALGGASGTAPRGALRVAAPASFGRMHLVPLLPDFLARYPSLTVDLRLSDTVVDLVEGAFDLAVRDAELADSSLVARKLAPDRRLLVAAPAYLARRGTPRTAADLLAHDCLVIAGQDQWTLAGEDGGTVKVSGPVRVDDGGAVRDLCAMGLGIALMSTWAAAEHLRRGDLLPVLTACSLVSRHALWAVYPSARLLAPKVRSLIDFLAERFDTTPFWDEGLAV